MIVALLAALVASPLALPQDTVLLKRVLVAGMEDRYRIETTSKQKIESGGKPIEDTGVSTSMDLLIRVEEIRADGRARVELVASDIKADVIGQPPLPAGPPKEIRVPAVLDSRNNLDAVALNILPPADQAVMGSVLATISQAPVFPLEPLKKGQQWARVVLPSPLVGTEETRLKFTFDGERATKAGPAWAVTMDDTVPISVDLGAMDSSNEKSLMTGKLHRKGMALFDAEGRLQLLESAVKHDFVVRSGKRTMSGVREETTKMTRLPLP